MFSSSLTNEDGGSFKKKGDVWFKSLYPKAGALEKLDEAEAEVEAEAEAEDQQQHNNHNMSGTDLWLSPADAAFEANQSAPGYIIQRHTTDAEDNDDNDDDIVDHRRR